MRDLQLKKGGRLFVKEWDNEENDFVEQEIDDEEFAFHLGDTICLGQGVTLRDFFIMVRNNLEVCAVSVGCPFLDDLVGEALIDPKKNKNKDGLVALQLSWSVFIEEEDDEEPSIIDHRNFCGIGDKEYALEFTPINEITIYPLILDENYTIRDGTEDDKIHFSTKKKFTLLDLLRGIIDELSYMGPPEIRAFALAELEKRAENLEDGTVKVFTPEELENRLKQRMEKTKKPCKICGKDARSPEFGKPSDICPKCFKNMKEN